MRKPKGASASKAIAIHRVLLKFYGRQECNLSHANPLQLLVATILSAQCTDKMVNRVGVELFKRCPDAKSFAKIGQTKLEPLIRQCGYYRAKAAHIIGACKMIEDEFGGEVPSTMDGLTRLPGVGRKTASVVLGDAFDVPALPVDTHVKRLSGLTGLSKSKEPDKIEADLTAALPPRLWNEFSHLLIAHGRRRCPARRPDCPNCEIASLCDFGMAKGSKGCR